MPGPFAKLEPRLCSAKTRSFYNLIDSVCAAKTGREPLHRFCSLMRKMDAEAFLLEDLAIDGELLEEKEAAKTRCGSSRVDLTAKRLTFFWKLPEGGNWRDPDVLTADDVIGYVIVANLALPDKSTRTYIFEAAIRPPSLRLEDAEGKRITRAVPSCYVHSTSDFDVVLGTEHHPRTIKMRGSYFAQQNDLTGVCAHATLRMAVNSSQLFRRRRLTTRSINQSLGIDLASQDRLIGHYNRDPEVAGGRGLGQEEIAAVIRGLGGRVHVANFVEKPSIEYDQWVYPFMESGCPVLLVVEGWGHYNTPDASGYFQHIFPVMGHTMNSDRWEPQARPIYGYYPAMHYLPASAWTDHYLISDDNLGVLDALPSDTIRNHLIPSKNPNLHVAAAIAIAPPGVGISGLDAETGALFLAYEWLGSPALRKSKWVRRLASSPIVCRTSLRTRAYYRRHLASLVGTLPTTVRQKLDRGSRYVWVTELSVPDLYTANRHKLGDIVLQATEMPEAQTWDDYFVMGWFPGAMRTAGGGAAQSWPIRGHVPLIHNSGVADAVMRW